MKYVLSNPYDANKLMEKVEEDINAGRNVEYKSILPPRSNRQNAFLHAIIGGFGAHFGYTINDVKYKLIKKSLCKDIFYVGTRKDIFGEDEEVYRSSAALDTKEFTDVINRFRNYAASVGFYIPDPDEIREAESFRIFCEQQIENNKDYLYLE